MRFSTTAPGFESESTWKYPSRSSWNLHKTPTFLVGHTYKDITPPFHMSQPQISCSEAENLSYLHCSCMLDAGSGWFLFAYLSPGRTATSGGLASPPVTTSRLLGLRQLSQSSSFAGSGELHSTAVTLVRLSQLCKHIGHR